MVHHVPASASESLAFILPGRTPLHVATQWNKVPIVKLLIQEGADLDAKDGQMWSALDHAKHGTADLIDLLKKVRLIALVSLKSGSGSGAIECMTIATGGGIAAV
jgi:ankyrin repeat protein